MGVYNLKFTQVLFTPEGKTSFYNYKEIYELIKNTAFSGSMYGKPFPMAFNPKQVRIDECVDNTL